MERGAIPWIGGLRGEGLIWYMPPMQQRPTPHGERIHSEAFLRLLMQRQLRLSVACALAFLVMLFGLPLANYLAPEFMARRILGGFTVSWFVLGIGCFPVVWLIAWVFIRRSIALEDDEVAEVQETHGGGGASGRR